MSSLLEPTEARRMPLASEVIASRIPMNEDLIRVTLNAVRERRLLNRHPAIFGGLRSGSIADISAAMSWGLVCVAACLGGEEEPPCYEITDIGFAYLSRHALGAIREGIIEFTPKEMSALLCLPEVPCAVCPSALNVPDYLAAFAELGLLDLGSYPSQEGSPSEQEVFYFGPKAKATRDAVADQLGLNAGRLVFVELDGGVIADPIQDCRDGDAARALAQ